MSAKSAQGQDELPALEKSELNEVHDDTILSLSEKGYSTYQIAEILKVNQSTVWRHLQKLNNKNIKLNHYKDNRVDYLVYQQLEETEIQAKLRAHLLNDDTIAALPEDKKIGWYNSFNVSSGTKFDKEQMLKGVLIPGININNISVDLKELIQACKNSLSVGENSQNQIEPEHETIDITPQSNSIKNEGTE